MVCAKNFNVVLTDGAPTEDPWAAISGIYQTKDGRWIQLHCNFPHHTAGTVEVLGVLGDVLFNDFNIDRNRIFLDRTVGVGVISRDDALSYVFTGPCLRATGPGQLPWSKSMPKPMGSGSTTSCSEVSKVCRAVTSTGSCARVRYA